MSTEHQSDDSVNEAKDLLKPLVAQAREYLAKLPEIRRLVERRDRVRSRLAHAQFARRARLIFDADNQKVKGFYADFRSFTCKVLVAFEQLRHVLPHAEVESLKSEVYAYKVGDTCRAVERAGDKVDKLSEWADRELRLGKFVKVNRISIAAVMRAARVYKPDMQKWRHGQLSDDSLMSQRIEDVIAGRTPLERLVRRRDLS